MRSWWTTTPSCVHRSLGFRELLITVADSEPPSPETDPETALADNVEQSIRRIRGGVQNITQLLLENQGTSSSVGAPDTPSLPLSSTSIGFRRGSILDLISPTTHASTVTQAQTPIQTPRAIMASHVTFNGTFAGLPGEDPLEYIEDVEIYGKKCEPNDEEGRKREMQAAFRQGLRGEAKTRWYLQLSSENRKWDAVQPLFTKRFKIREADLSRGVGARVFNLKRRPTESIREFVSRATELSYQCTDEQMKELRYRLYAHMAVPEGHRDFDSDCRVQERVSDRLFGLQKMSGDGVMKNSCEFEDVKGCILGCIRRPGAEDDDEPRTTPQEVMTSEEVNLQTAKVVRELLHEVARMRETPRDGRSPSTPGSVGPPYPGITYTAQPSGGQGDAPQRQVGFEPHRDQGPNPGNDVYKPPQNRESWGWQRYRGGQRGGYQGQANRGGHVRQSSWGTSSRVGPSTNYAANWTCYNCGNKGHGSTSCPHDIRSSAVRREIQDLIQRGEPIPDRLRVIEQSQPHAVVEIHDDVEEVTSAVASMAFAEPLFPSKATWDKWKKDPSVWPDASCPALAGAAKRARTEEHLDDDDHVAEAAPPTPPRGSTTSARLPSSPHPGKEETEKVKKGREALLRLKDQLKEALNAKGKRKDTIPVRLFGDDEKGRFNIRDWLRNTDVTMTVGQLMDRSPQIRSQMYHELGLADRGQRGRRTGKVPSKRRVRSATAETVPVAVGRITFRDTALPDTKTTYLAYTAGTVKGVEVERILIDDGSLGELIGPALVDRLGLKRCEVERPMYLKMAEDSSTPIKHYVMVPVVVGDIMTVVQAYVTGQNQIYDLLLGRSWLVRNRATHEYGTDTLTLHGQGGYVTTVQLRMRGTGREPTLSQETGSPSGSGSESDDEHSTEVSEDEESGATSPEGETLLSLVDEVELLDILEYLGDDPTIAEEESSSKNK